MHVFVFCVVFTCFIFIIVYKLFLCFVGRGLLVAEAAWSIAQDTTESQVDIVHVSCTEFTNHQVGLNISLYDTDFFTNYVYYWEVDTNFICMYINSISAISNYCAEFLDKLSGHVKS